MGYEEQFKSLDKRQQKDIALKFALDALEHIDQCNDESCEFYWQTVSFFGKELKRIE